MQMVMPGTWYENEYDGRVIGVESDSFTGPEAQSTTIGPNYAQQAQRMAFPQASGLPIDNCNDWQHHNLAKYNPLVKNIMNEIIGKQSAGREPDSSASHYAKQTAMQHHQQGASIFATNAKASVETNIAERAVRHHKMTKQNEVNEFKKTVLTSQAVSSTSFINADRATLGRPVSNHLEGYRDKDVEGYS